MEELPQQCNYWSLGAARIREIKSIVSKLDSSEHGGRAFQKLPRHMQRRAVSSNPRRLPRYLRDKHMREGGGNTKPSHRPPRKYRRRPSNLLQEYNRRQKEYVWVETHIWHAKRFHMQRKWGYALPDAPTCKGHRASLRAATTGCLLQDVSYLCCIELGGIKTTILTGLSKVLQKELLSFLTSPQVLSGKHWMSSMFFQPGRQPYGAVGKVDVLFHPSEDKTDNEDRVNVWLWSHPSSYTQIVETLAEIFGLGKENGTKNHIELCGKVSDKEEDGEGVLGDKEETRGDCEVVEGKEEVCAGDDEAEDFKREMKIDGERKENDGDVKEKLKAEELREEYTGNTEKNKKEVPAEEKVKSSDDDKEKFKHSGLREDDKTEDNKREPIDARVREDGEGVQDKEVIVDGGEEEAKDIGESNKTVKEKGKDQTQEETTEDIKGVEEENDTKGKGAGKGRVRRKTKEPKNINVEKLKMRNIPFERTPKYSSSDSSTTMTLLKDTLNRFRLTGPMSCVVLSSAFQPANMMMEETMEMDGSGEAKGQWWKDYYCDEESMQNHRRQVATWRQLSSSSPHPSAKLVLPLTIRDPRVTLPTKKVPMEEEEEEPGNTKDHNLPEWPPVQSPMYKSDLRDQVTLCKEADAVINKRRSQNLVPGSLLPETPLEARLPLLLLSRPPTSAGFGSGWEVVAPAGWGMSVFLPLVFNGGVVSGQRGAENLHLEALTPIPPHLLPDTPAGDVYSAFLAAERQREFFKRPPACRYNYIKLGVQFPFTQPWRKLLRNWQPGITDFFVLRDSKLISALSEKVKNGPEISDNTEGRKELAHNLNISGENKLVPGNGSAGNSNINNRGGMKRKSSEGTNFDRTKIPKHELRDDKIHTNIRERNDEADIIKFKDMEEEELHMDVWERSEEINTEEANTSKCKQVEINKTSGNERTNNIEQELRLVSQNCLVMVQLVLASKGTLKPCAMICLPRKEDLIPNLVTGKEQEPVREPLHDDTNHAKREKMKKEHTKIKGRMRRVRHKARQRAAKEMDFASGAHSISHNIKTATTQALSKVDQDNEAILKKYSSYKEEMESAWLMNTEELIQCCTRPIIGYTTQGTFSYTHGKAAAIGWVGLKPLLTLIDLCKKGQTHNSLLELSRRGKVSRCLPVLVRNPSTLQYHWAKLSIVEHPPIDTR